MNRCGSIGAKEREPAARVVIQIGAVYALRGVEIYNGGETVGGLPIPASVKARMFDFQKGMYRIIERRTVNGASYVGCACALRPLKNWPVSSVVGRPICPHNAAYWMAVKLKNVACEDYSETATRYELGRGGRVLAASLNGTAVYQIRTYESHAIWRIPPARYHYSYRPAIYMLLATRPTLSVQEFVLPGYQWRKWINELEALALAENEICHA